MKKIIFTLLTSTLLYSQTNTIVQFKQSYLNDLQNKTTSTGATLNFIPKINAVNSLGNSQIFDNGTNIGINNILPTEKLDLVGNMQISETNYLKFPHVNQINAQDGRIGNNLSVDGLNIFGTQTVVAGGRKISLLGNTALYGAIMPNNVSGTAGQFLTSAGANNPPTWTANNFHIRHNFLAIRSNSVMNGGGTITYNPTGHLTWSERFILIGCGTGIAGGLNATNGFKDITMPPVGTVIPGFGGASAQTVTANGIPMVGNYALYYRIATGGSASVNSNFMLVGFSVNFTVTDDMVLIAVLNGDSQNVLKLGNGQFLFRNNKSVKGGTPTSITNYTTTALAIADANLPIGANYTVDVAGAKQLYVK